MSSVQSPVIDEKTDENTEIEIDNVVESDSSGDNVFRREVWNKSVNGSAAVMSGIVIGGEADSWPSLSEGANMRIKPTYKTVPEVFLFIRLFFVNFLDSFYWFVARILSVL